MVKIVDYESFLKSILDYLIYGETEISSDDSVAFNRVFKALKIYESKHYRCFLELSLKIEFMFHKRDQRNLTDIDWLLLVFEDICDKVVKEPSWTSFIIVLNVVKIIIMSAKNTLSNNDYQNFENFLTQAGFKILDKKFRKFITEKCCVGSKIDAGQIIIGCLFIFFLSAIGFHVLFN